MSAGETEQVGLSEPVPLWCFLRLCEAQGTGVSQHRVDCRVHRPTPPGQDRQLHPYLLAPWTKAPQCMCTCVSVCCDKAHSSPTCPGGARCPRGCPASLTLSETALGPAGGLGTCSHTKNGPSPHLQSKEAPSALCLQLLTCLRSMWSLLCPSLTRENLGGA